MALESGRVNSYREALVLVRLRDGLAIECVVDTGFDGGLMLPRTVVSQIQIATIGELTFAMVGGASLSAEVGLTEIDWLGSMLLGTELLIGATLPVDYPTSTVTITTAPGSAIR